MAAMMLIALGLANAAVHRALHGDPLALILSGPTAADYDGAIVDCQGTR